MNPYHVGYIFSKRYLFLHKGENSGFTWYKMTPSLDQEEETSCRGETVVYAIQEAYKCWKEEYFSLIHCRMRYTLPHQDQVGSPALFWQMAKSYATSNGHYFDDEMGHLCFVDFASQEALSLPRRL